MRLKYLYTIMIILLLGCDAQNTGPVEQAPLKESIIIGGSQSVTPILKTLAGEFEADNPLISIDFGPQGHTGSGIKGVQENIYDLGALSRELNPKEKAHGLTEFWFARDALIFAVNSGLEMNDLSTHDIRSIYYGEITSWKDMGGPDMGINILDRYEGASPRVLLYKTAFFERDITDRAIILQSPNDMNVALLNTPFSIGYTSLASILKTDIDVRIIALDGIRPSPENIAAGKYPLARPQGLVARADLSNPAKKFVDFVFSKKGHSILKHYGYVPTEK